MTQSYEGPPQDFREPNLQTALIRLSKVVQSIMRGRTNNTGEVTLTANTTTTTITDSRIAHCSAVSLIPVTANAAAALATTYYANTSRVNGSLVLTHANNAQTDRTFQMVING